MSSEKKSSSPMKILFLAIFIDLLGFGIIIPHLPYMIDYFDTSKYGGDGIALGWIIAIYSISQFIFSPIWGRASDRIGRRPIILIGLFGSFLSFSVFAFSKSFESIMVSRALAGFFTAASLPTARAYIADITPKEERAVKFGLLGAAFGLGFTFGPVLGGLLGEISIGSLGSHAAPSFFAAILAIINGIMATRSLAESLSDEIRLVNRSLDRSSLVTKLQLAVKFKGIPILLILFGLTTFVFAGFESIFSLFAREIDDNITQRGIGFIFGFIGIIVIFVQVRIIKPTVEKFGEENTVKIGLIVLGLGFFLLIFVKTILSLVFACIPMAIGSALLNPSIASSISNRIPADQQGGIQGLNSSISALGRVFGPLLAGYIFEENITYPFILGLVVIAALVMISLLWLNPRDTSE